jgi:enoyl-CoA hydratase/carnithine racemase
MTAFLTHTIGASNAALMILTGEPIDAERALAWGLVSEVVQRGAVLSRAQEIAKIVASRAPIAAETAKLNLRASLSMPLDRNRIRAGPANPTGAVVSRERRGFEPLTSAVQHRALNRQQPSVPPRLVGDSQSRP